MEFYALVFTSLVSEGFPMKGVIF